MTITNGNSGIRTMDTSREGEQREGSEEREDMRNNHRLR